uniref:Uncharacterized protein n=1 Tax=Rhinolophus ferrumequinum TaxID=59479 RepID=A0A671DUH8_RHIFE
KELSAKFWQKLQQDLEAEHVLLNPCGVGQVRGEDTALETLAGEHVHRGRAPAHPCL